MEHPLRRYRKDHELSLEQLASNVGATAATISRIETGRQKPGIDLLQRLRDETKIPVEQLRPDLAEAMKPRAAADAPKEAAQ